MTARRLGILKRFASSGMSLIVTLLGWAIVNHSRFALDDSKGPCGLQEIDHTDYVERLAYDRLLDWHFTETAQPVVAIVTLTPQIEPLSIFNNTCESRRFVALLVPKLSQLGAKVIAIDKYYSEGSCTEKDANSSLRTALNASSTPVIVGQAVHERKPAQLHAGDDCLVLTPAFDFRTAAAKGRSPKPSRVRTGLTRLNENTLQVPLRWPVFSQEPSLGPVQKRSVLLDSFALRTAEAADEELVKDPTLQRQLVDNQHPFAEVSTSIPTWSGLDVLCHTGGSGIVQKKGWGSCSNISHKPYTDLSGKVVVVGEHVEGDVEPVPGGTSFGVDLQANYIDALLTRRFLREFDPAWDWRLALTFIFLPVVIEWALDALLERWNLPRLQKKKELVIASLTLVLLGIQLLVIGMLLRRHSLFAPVLLLAVFPATLALFYRIFQELSSLLGDRFHSRKVNA